jgi:hypothetical protein
MIFASRKIIIYPVRTDSKMKTTLTAILCMSMCLLLLAETDSTSQTTNKYGGLTAVNWRDVFSRRAQLSDFDYDGKTTPADFFKFSSSPPTTNDWQAYWTKLKTIDGNYNDFFFKTSALSDQSIQVFANLLQDPTSASNQIIQRCVLFRISMGCNTNAHILIPLIQPYLSSDSICTQLAALNGLHSLGPAPLSFTNDLVTCLNSSNDFIRAAAAQNLSELGACSRPYLPLIESLARNESKTNTRKVMKHAADKIKERSQPNDTPNPQSPSSPGVGGR